MFKRSSRSTAEKSSEKNAAKPSEKKAEKTSKKKKAEKTAAKDVKTAVQKAEAQVYRKPKADVYTLMLSIALLAIVLATVALWMAMKVYDYRIKGGPDPAWHLPAATTSFDPPRAVA